MQTFISDVHAIGLPIAQNLLLTAAFYWDLDDQSRAWAKRFGSLSGGRMPTMAQAGVYSAIHHYTKATAKAGTTEPAAVVAAMRDTPVEDMMTHGARIRDDGWVMRDLYLFRIKTPAESRAPWDYYTLISKIDAEAAAPPPLADCKPNPAKP